MAMDTNMRNLERYAEKIGMSATVALSAFFGGHGRALHVPLTADPKHIICKVIGEEAFTLLVAAYGGQRLAIPMLDTAAMKNAGRVWMLRQRNISATATAALVGLTPERVRQITEQLRREGFFELAGDIAEPEEQL